MAKKKKSPLQRALKNYRKSLLKNEGIVSKEASLAIFNSRKLGKPGKGYSRNDGFYDSKEWKQVRYQALRDHGRKCACCGATPANGAQMHVDHIKPRYKFPELSLDLNNLQVLCSDCNQGKGAWDTTDFRPGQRRLFKAPAATVGA